jgi:peptidoglycan/xylan/chitin deacetylase (PgdA/CDA1 family)
MKKPYRFPLAFCVILLALSCQSLNRSAEQLDLPDRIVVFTFDDGPNGQGDTTAKLLDVLGKYEIRAMFALLGENVERYPDLVRRIRDEGHYIINHGYTDSWAVNMDREAFVDNLKKGEAALATALGEAPYPGLYRPQGGYYKKQHETAWREAGYMMIPGTARPYDAVLSARHENRVIKNIVRTIEKQGGGIIMLHDGRDSYRKIEAGLKKRPDGEFNRAWIPETVEKLIVLLLEKGYVLNGFDALEVIEKKSPW